MIRTNWHVLKNSEDHASAIARLIELAASDLKPGTEDFDEFELLGLLIEHYENHAFPMDKPDPIEAIKFRMDQQGLTQADMRQFIGSTSKVSEVLNRKRPLSLSMIRRLHDGLGIPADILIQDMRAIEWSLVDVEDDETTIVGTLFTCEQSSDLSHFSKSSTKSYFSTALLNLNHKKAKDSGKQSGISSGYALMNTMTSGLTVASTQRDRLTSDMDYALVS